MVGHSPDGEVMLRAEVAAELMQGAGSVPSSQQLRTQPPLRRSPFWGGSGHGHMANICLVEGEWVLLWGGGTDGLSWWVLPAGL